MRIHTDPNALPRRRIAGLAPLRPPAPHAAHVQQPKTLGEIWSTAPEPVAALQLGSTHADAAAQHSSSNFMAPLALGTLAAAVTGLVAVRGLGGYAICAVSERVGERFCVN